MKKVLAFISALTMAGAIAAGSTAFAETTDTKTIEYGSGGSNSQTTTVSYDLPQSYTITIPSIINLTTEKAEVGVVKAENVHIPNGKWLNVFVKSSNGYTVRTSGSSYAQLNYELYIDNATSPVSGVNDVRLFQCTNGAESNQATLYANLSNGGSWSGSYRDTLTFSVTVVG